MGRTTESRSGGKGCAAGTWSLTLVLCFAPASLHAEEVEAKSWPRAAAVAATDTAEKDRYEVTTRSETYVRLFRRALLPGPAGALVTTETASPLTEYLSVHATNVDSPWHRDAIELEVSAWGQLWPTSSGYERPFDGDVQSANVRYRLGPGWLRLGRQLVAGGAARFSRFDGLSVGGQLESGWALLGYGGAAVLPRWDALPGYHQLGKAERELVVGAPLDLDRSAHWVAGARLAYQSERLSGAVSWHEQHERGGVGRRNLGLDLNGQLLPELGYGGSALVELSAGRLADLRAWLDVAPHRALQVSVEALRTEPALFLSRQSVLSVFSTAGYSELGGALRVQARRWLRLEGSGYGEVYDEGRPGARAELGARFEIDRYYATYARLAFSRVMIGEAGYQQLRASLGRRLSRTLRSTAELYGFFYDQPVQGYRTSSVYSATLDYRASERLALLWGASLARSPYSRLDAQTLLRLSYELDVRAREGGW